MKSIGFLTIKNSQELSFFTDIALENGEAFEFFRFTPLDINPTTEMVHGYQFNQKTSAWKQGVFPIPLYIYDRCFYPSHNNRYDKYKPIVKWLKNRPGTTFLGYGLPNKWEIYTNLSKHHPISSYLPETVLISTYKELNRYLTKHISIVLKPISGSQGNGILHIKLERKKITIQTQKRGQILNEVYTNAEDFKALINILLSKTTYIGQKHLLLQQNNHPFDIRILLQKDEKGLWLEQGRGIRFGKEDGLVSNIHNGGIILPFESLQAKLSPHLFAHFQEEIQTIVSHLPNVLEECFGRLFELGLDIGIEKNGAVWLIDINSKPGRKVITVVNPSKKEQLLQAPLNYLMYLEQEKTISN